MPHYEYKFTTSSENAGAIVQLSHSSLDGHAASWLVNIQHHCRYTCNIEHKHHNDKLKKVLQNTPNIGHLVITGLRITPMVAATLAENVDKFKKLTIISKMVHADVSMDRIMIACTEHRVEAKLIFNPDQSVAKSTAAVFTRRDHFADNAIIAAIDAWVMHRRTECVHTYLTGEHLNDVFTMVKPLVDKVILGDHSHLAMHAFMNAISRVFATTWTNHVKDNPRLIDTVLAVTMMDVPSVKVIERDIRKWLVGNWADEFSVRSEIENHCVNRTFTQSIYILLARLSQMTDNPQSGHWVETIYDDTRAYTRPYRLKISARSIPAAIQHHWFYTLQCYDGVMVQQSSGKVELRQADDRPEFENVDLQVIGNRYGVDGHRCAVSFIPMRDQTPTMVRANVVSAIKEHIQNVICNQ